MFKMLSGNWWKGLEIKWNDLRMVRSGITKIVLVVGGVHFCIWAGLMFSVHSDYFVKFYREVFGSSFWGGCKYLWHNTSWFFSLLSVIGGNAGRMFWFSFPVWVAAPVAIYYFGGVTEELLAATYQKGARVFTVDELVAAIGDKRTNIVLKVVAQMPGANVFYEAKDVLGWKYKPVKLPRFIENYGTQIIGQTGSGKSALIDRIIETIIANKEPGIYHDPACSSIEKYYSEVRGDVVFNTYDARFTTRWGKEGLGGWTIFNDVKTRPAVKTFMRLVFPQIGNDPFWPDGTYTLGCAIMEAIIATEPGPKNTDLFSVIDKGPKGVRDYCQATAPGMCATYFADLQSKPLQTFFMSLTIGLEPFRDLRDGSFSITDWVNDRDGSQIFVTNRADKADALRVINTAFFEMAGVLLLSQTEDEERRTWVVLDEIFELGKLNVIQRLPKLGRKNGVCVIAATQDFAQGDIIYGKAGRETIFNNLSNRFFFRAGGTTQEELAKIIGDADTISKVSSVSYGVADNKDGGNVSDKEERKGVVMPSEIGGLRTFENYMSLMGYPFCHNILVPPERRPKVALGFIQADGFELATAAGGAAILAAKRAAQAKQKAEKEQEEQEASLEVVVNKTDDSAQVLLVSLEEDAAATNHGVDR